MRGERGWQTGTEKKEKTKRAEGVRETHKQNSVARKRKGMEKKKRKRVWGMGKKEGGERRDNVWGYPAVRTGKGPPGKRKA